MNVVEEKSPYLTPIYNLKLLVSDEPPTDPENAPINFEISLCSYGGKAEGFFPGLVPCDFSKQKKKKEQIDRYVRLMRDCDNVFLDLLLERNGDVEYTDIKNNTDFRITNGCSLIDLVN